jgi:predicted MFS family arabinose efflux permease
MTAFAPRLALLIGNFITGIAVLAPTGMLHVLADGLSVSIPQAALLVTYGAVLLCFASPIVSFATSRVDRRTLLAGTLLLVAIAHIASAFVPSYAALLALRLVMLTFAAVFTPQAASTIALLVPEKERSGAIAFVFIGWSLSVAAGLPLVTYISATFGWRACFAVLGVIAFAAALLLALTLPKNLRGARVSLHSWVEVANDRLIVLLLLMTILVISGQFLVLTFFGPLVIAFTGAGPGAIATYFAIFGVMGFAGSVVATQMVSRFGAFVTSATATLAILLGMLVWSAGAGSHVAMGAGSVIWGLGFAAANAMQQARLYAAAPALASVSVALNTSGIYVGQAAGSFAGSVMFSHGMAAWMGYAGAAFVVASLIVWAFTRPKVASS